MYSYDTVESEADFKDSILHLQRAASEHEAMRPILPTKELTFRLRDSHREFARRLRELAGWAEAEFEKIKELK